MLPEGSAIPGSQDEERHLIKESDQGTKCREVVCFALQLNPVTVAALRT